MTTSRGRATKHVPRVSPYSHASSIDPRFVEIGLACIHTYPHCCCCCGCCCAACICFSAIFSRHRSLFFLCYCDMYLRFRGCPVVLDIQLSVSAWYQKTRRILLRARRILLLLLLQQRGAAFGVPHNFQNYMQNKITMLCQSEHAKIPPHLKRTHIKRTLFSLWKIPTWTCELEAHES